MSHIAMVIIVICAIAGVIGLSWITTIAQLDSSQDLDRDRSEDK
jgi:hypothetical protein